MVEVEDKKMKVENCNWKKVVRSRLPAIREDDRKAKKSMNRREECEKREDETLAKREGK